MPIQVEIPDSNLAGYSSQAKDALKDAVESYVRALVKEIKQNDQVRRGRMGGNPDVSVTTVSDSKITLRSSFGGESAGWGAKTIRILAGVFDSIAGFTFNAAPQSQLYMLGFVVIFALAVIFTVLSVVRE